MSNIIQFPIEKRRKQLAEEEDIFSLFVEEAEELTQFIMGYNSKFPNMTVYNIVSSDYNKTIPIVVERSGDIKILETTLGSRPNLTTGRVDQQIGTLGVFKNPVSIELNFQESIIYGFNKTKWAMTLMTSSLKMIFQGNVSRDEVGSVIMIGEMAGNAAQAGLVPFLYLMALISVNLAYINILPIPGLDGGHIALILIEVLMGRKLSVKTRIRIQSVGMFILLSLMVFLLFNDIMRVITRVFS